MEENNTKIWFYIKDRQQQGPVGRFELEKLFEQGILNSNTYLWTKEMKCWQMAKILEPFKSCFKEDLPHDSNLNYQELDTFPKGRPLVRFIARMFDLSIFTIVFITSISIFSPELIIHSSKIIIFMITLLLWLIIEPIVLSIFGNTLGKALLNTKIKTVNGEVIDFLTAFKRSIFVIAAGMGFGLPIITFITFIFSYFDLTGHGISTWDDKSGTIILYGKVEFSRALLACALPVALLTAGMMV